MPLEVWQPPVQPRMVPRNVSRGYGGPSGSYSQATGPLQPQLAYPGEHGGIAVTRGLGQSAAVKEQGQLATSEDLRKAGAVATKSTSPPKILPIHLLYAAGGLLALGLVSPRFKWARTAAVVTAGGALVYGIGGAKY